jgi:Zn-dependent M28 family amino/carboxypeptidase
MSDSLRSRRARLGAGAVAGLVALTGAVLTATPAAAAPAAPAVAGCGDLDEFMADTLLECVTLGGVRAHLDAFQGIADDNGGTRASGTPGFDASAEYVAEQAAAAGLTVSTQEFEFPFFEELSAPTFAQTAPTPTTYVAGTDFATMSLSGSGDVTGTAVPVDLLLPPTGGSTSGCEAADFAGFPAGAIALMQRGTCDFGVKATNAANAGAVGAVIFNEGNAPDRTELLLGNLGTVVPIPVVGTPFALGESLQNTTLNIRVDAIAEIRSPSNVFAELPGKTDQVLMVGAHLDSVPEGPGINDNGSGSAAILEVAEQLAESTPTATVRFAWWGAEELGLVGSEFYVASLPPAELERIYGYLNFDMVASPNYATFLYDGDDSDAEGAGPGPAGSTEIEDIFEQFYGERGLPSEGTDFDGRSDYGPFIAAGIPAGGVFTGAEGIKTPEQVALYGGTAGEPFDPCYHQECDTIANISDEALDVNSDAISCAVFTAAYFPERIGGAA